MNNKNISYNDKNVVDFIIGKANLMLQALNNVETKGKTNLDNLSGSINALEEIVKAAVDAINALQGQVDQLNRQIDNMKPAEIEK